MFLSTGTLSKSGLPCRYQGQPLIEAISMTLPSHQPLQDTNHNMLVGLLFVLNIQYTSGWATTKTLEENCMALEIYHLIRLHATGLSDSAQ